MSTTDRAATFYWPAFAGLSDKPTAYLNPAGYAVIELADNRELTMHVHTPAQCDALIRAAVAAKDLLLAAQSPPPLAFTRDLTVDAGGEVWPSDDRGNPAPLPAGHCPICGGELCADGSHISANSGAHIPAEPQQVSP